MKFDEIEIHDIQIKILKELLFNPNARFRDLNVTKLTNDHFTFHLNKLVKEGLVTKEDQRYRLTSRGKEFANRMDTEQLKIERQAKLGCLTCAVRKEASCLKYLMQKRLKEPYYGFWGIVGGKVRWGERLEEAAVREFSEETGLSGEFTFKGIEHKMDYSATGELLEDKFFMVFRVDEIRGELIEKFQGGENRWFTRNEIGKIECLFDDVPLILDMINCDGISFCEDAFTVQSY